MEAVALAGSADPLTIFRRHIIKRTEMVLGRMARAPNLLPERFAADTFHILDYAFELPEAWPFTRQLLRTAAPKMEQAGHWVEWIRQLEQGIERSRQWNDANSEAELRLHLGQLHQRRNQYDLAREQLEASARLYRRLNQPRGLAQALNQLAYLARLQRRYDEAGRLIDTVRDLLADDDEGWAFSLYVLALIALDKRRWPESVAHSRQAAALSTGANQRRLLGRSLLCCGVALEKKRDLPAAEEICRQAIAVFAGLEDQFYQAIAQMNLGNVYLALAQWPAALEQYQQAERIFRKAEDWVHLGHVNNNLGLAQRRLKNWPAAKAAYTTGVEYWERVGNIERLVNTLDGLGLTYLAAGQPERAKAIFVAALARLAEIEGQPGYDHWRAVITRQLAQVSGDK